jgi:hypothetical protein
MMFSGIAHSRFPFGNLLLIGSPAIHFLNSFLFKQALHKSASTQQHEPINRTSWHAAFCVHPHRRHAGSFKEATAEALSVAFAAASPVCFAASKRISESGPFCLYPRRKGLRGRVMVSTSRDLANRRAV